MNQVLTEGYEKVQAENRELKMVMRKLSHEMGNALTLLGASVYYLENRMTKDGSGFDIKDLKGDYMYICNLFNDLREYNHAETMEKKEIFLTDIIWSIEDSFKRIKGSDKVELIIEKNVDADNIKIYADETKMRQVIINILKNGMEAMEDNEEEKGKKMVFRIGTENVDDDIRDVEMQAFAGTKIVHIEIRDNGKGIPKQVLEDIFQPMFTYEKKEGTGLGLSVVKKIIEDHRGKIKAVSVPGTGTAMHIYIPIYCT